MGQERADTTMNTTASPAPLPMPTITIAVAALLIALGLVGYFLSAAANPVTALIPAFVGVPLLICGLVGLRGGTARKHAMHAAAMLALLGALAPAGRLIMAAVRGTAPSGLLAVSLIGMLVLCGALLALCIKSFKDARRAREAAAV